MSKLRANDLKKLRKLMLLLASEHAGEIVAAAEAMRRTLERAGCSFHDLAVALGSAPAVRVVEKVVYRDRIFEKEKIVYRDPPFLRQAPERKLMCASEIAAQGNVILDTVQLSRNERNFVENITARAENDGARFAMTERQITWFNDIAARSWGEAE